MTKHLFVPDVQVRPGVSTDHLRWMAFYAMDKLDPDTDKIVFAGDFYDMPSLSSYDKRGSKSLEGRRLAADLQSGHDAIDMIEEIWAKRRFAPRVYITLGNHEYRLDRAINETPTFLEGLSGLEYAFEDYSWHVSPFLRPIEIDGVLYSHFFPHNARGQVTQTKHGAPCAKSQAQRQMKSATAGHQQGFDYAVVPTPSGYVQGLIAGSFYLHNEPYMMGLDNYWRGLVLKHNVRRGMYALCQVEMDWLRGSYAKYKK